MFDLLAIPASESIRTGLTVLLDTENVGYPLEYLIFEMR